VVEKELSPLIKRLFVAAPLFLSAVYVVGCILTRADETFIYGSVAAAKLLGGLGLMLAAVRYGRREYLFWAWALLSANLSLLGVAELLFTSRFNLAHLGPHAAEVAWAALIVVANLFAATGTLMLARVWRAVGLALPDPSGAKRMGAIAGMLVAAAAVVYVTLPALKGMLKGEALAIVIVVGAVSDLVCFSVITPLALRALALRGGTLAWPWGLISGCFFAWMVYDVVGIITLSMTSATGDAAVNGLRILACLLGMGAGLAQRWAIRASAARE
jgi:hypothetical protein